MALLEAMGGLPKAPAVVMITAHGDERRAVEAIKLGAVDYFRKPFEANDIIRAVRRALKVAHLGAENRRLRAGAGPWADDGLCLAKHVSGSPSWSSGSRIRDVTVLVEGESGRARSCGQGHRSGIEARPENPLSASIARRFTAIWRRRSCLATREAPLQVRTRPGTGFFERPMAASFLLDELNALPSMAQGLLLRVLQEREVRPLAPRRPSPSMFD